MNTGFIWGAILVTLGSALLLKSLYNIALPLIRPFVGCVLIYLGLHIMMDPFTASVDKKTVIFGQFETALPDDITTYNVICGSGKLDVSAAATDDSREITINVIFGTQKIIIDTQVPTKVRINALFSRAVMPDETLFSFGRNVYKNREMRDAKLTIHVNVVFGSIDVVLKQLSAQEEVQKNTEDSSIIS